MVNQDEIKKYSDMYPNELKMLLKRMPKDDIDWALVLYLLEYTSKGNVITLGKISSYFGLDQKDAYERLNDMYWLVIQYVTFEYEKDVYIYEISEFGADVLLKLTELLEVKTSRKKTKTPGSS